MKQLSWFLIISLIYGVLSIINNTQLINAAHQYKSAMEEYSHQLNFENRLLDMDEWTNADEVWPKKQQRANKVMAKAKSYEQHSTRRFFSFLLLTLAYILISFFFYRQQPKAPRILPAAITLIAIICLHAGLFTPMLEIAAYQQDLTVPIKMKGGLFGLNLDFTQHFAGEMYFYYQSKSIVELIILLFQQSNYVVGISILLFSILIPVAKLLFALLVLFRPNMAQSSFAQFVLQKTGKWSMADVFVVAIFLGFLAFNSMQTGINTESNVLIGLYFFFAYCVLSIGLPIFLERLRERT